jgi:DNA-binding PadR family transcriptional regulator
MMESVRYRRKDIALIMERSRSTSAPSRDSFPESFLPLSDAAYGVLLALAGPPVSDQGLMEALSENAHIGRLNPGSLRSALGRMAEQGLVHERPESGHAAGDGPYRVTELGYAVLLAESGRRRRGRDVA